MHFSQKPRQAEDVVSPFQAFKTPLKLKSALGVLFTNTKSYRNHTNTDYSFLLKFVNLRNGQSRLHIL